MASSRTTKVDPDLILGSQVAQGLAVIGDRCAFLIIRDIYLGSRRFEELRKRTEAARGTLTSRLKSLVEHGILYKSPYQSSPVRHEYRLTEKGLDLYPMVLLMWNWEHKWGQNQYLPATLSHRTCGKEMTPLYRCTECRNEVLPQDFSFFPGESFEAVKKVPPRFQRRSKSKQEKNGYLGPQQVSVLDCVGDRWTSLVLAASFFGLQRFDDIAEAIGIATNILSDRLKALVNMGVFDRVPYRDRPVRYEYHLSDKGRDLYQHTIAIHEWASRWLIKPGKEPLILRHARCDTLFNGEVVCSECEQLLDPHEVTYNHH